jgi:hypothetical protein
VWAIHPNDAHADAVLSHGVRVQELQKKQNTGQNWKNTAI